MSRLVAFGDLRKIGLEETYYELEAVVSDDQDRELSRTWVALTGEELLSWPRTRLKVFAVTGVIATIDPPKRVTITEYWLSVVNDMSETAIVEERPVETTERGALVDLIYDAFLGLPVCEDAETFARGGSRYETPGVGSLPVLGVRWGDFNRMLDNLSCHPKRADLWAALRSIGAVKKKIRIDDATFNTLAISSNQVAIWLHEQGRNGSSSDPVPPLRAREAHVGEGGGTSEHWNIDLNLPL